MSRRRTFGTIRKLPSGRYQARYTSPDGVRHRAPRSFATKAEASRWLASSENDLARGTWTDPDAARVALDVYARGWLTPAPEPAAAHDRSVRELCSSATSSRSSDITRSARSRRRRSGAGMRILCGVAAAAR